MSKKHVLFIYKYKVKIITRLRGSVFFNGSHSRSSPSALILMILDACNVYKDLQFPEEVYEHISEYHEQKVET